MIYTHFFRHGPSDCQKCMWHHVLFCSFQSQLSDLVCCTPSSNQGLPIVEEPRPNQKPAKTSSKSGTLTKTTRWCCRVPLKERYITQNFRIKAKPKQKSNTTSCHINFWHWLDMRVQTQQNECEKMVSTVLERASQPACHTKSLQDSYFSRRLVSNTSSGRMVGGL